MHIYNLIVNFLTSRHTQKKETFLHQNHHFLFKITYNLELQNYAQKAMYRKTDDSASESSIFVSHANLKLIIKFRRLHCAKLQRLAMHQ